MKIDEYTISEGRIRVYSFDKEDLKFIVKGYQYAEDEDLLDNTGYCVEEIELQGEWFDETFDDFDKAIEKYLELKYKGWEVVELLITPKQNTEVDPSLWVSNNPKIVKLSTRVNLKAINEKLEKKLNKIKEILDKE